MKNTIKLISFLILAVSCMDNQTKINKGIDLKIVTIGPLDSTELFSKEMYQLFQPIEINDTILNAFDKSYIINISRIDKKSTSEFSLKGKESMWDLQLFGKPKSDKLKELAFSNFEDVPFNNKINKPSNNNLCDLKSDLLYYLNTQEAKGNYTVFLYGKSCIEGNLFEDKYKIYNDFNTLKKDLIESYRKGKNKFLVVHKIQCCEIKANITPPIKRNTTIKKTTPNEQLKPKIETPNIQLGDITYNNNYIYFSKCDNCPIDITITKKFGTPQTITIKDYKKNNLNIASYNLTTYEEYNIKITDRQGNTRNSCVVPIQKGNLCDCKK